MEQAAGGDLRSFDAIGLCFPDVVIQNRIVGGETHKTHGLRDNPELDYEEQFAEITALNSRLAAYVVEGGPVMNTNDGPMAAFAAAVEAWGPDFNDRIRSVKDYAAQALSAIEGVTLISSGDAPHILAISLLDFSGQTLVEALGGQEVCVSSGSACHRGKPSHVFAALKLPRPQLDGALRISFSCDTTREDVDALIKGLRAAKEQLFPTLS